MRQFVRAHISHPLVDFSVYSRNRCFRCHKFGQFQRRFNYEGATGGDVGPTLVQVLQCPNPLECDTKIDYRVTGNGNVDHRNYASVGAFDLKNLNVPESWKPELRGMECDDLLRVISPDQEYNALFRIGCAYKRAGGSADTFYHWHSRGPRVPNQGWR